MEFIYTALEYIVSFFYLLFDFVASIPELFKICAEYLIYTALKLYIEFKISMVELSYSLAQAIFTDYEIYALISSSFNAMPDNLRSAAYKFGVVEAVRIVVDAFGTAFVLRFIN